ncbi:hypothetical protein SAMN05660226_04164 [Parapedobacter luteus]|uniref:Uncharacterized protein n=1 Tax=Parapedobacter luteus TaxID=623280 RepID=A0A1T5FSA6_9SPHI|nr:hypothetical protein SAMN05660226_04164 [Parapedobacter luteus]
MKYKEKEKVYFPIKQCFLHNFQNVICHFRTTQLTKMKKVLMKTTVV